MTKYLSPEDEQIVLRLPLYEGIELRNWTSYAFNEDFVTPTDAFHFELGDEHFSDAAKKLVTPGALVHLDINGSTECAGYIDSVEKDATRSGGTTWKIEGRDMLSPYVDCHLDPRLQFKADTTLRAFLEKVFETSTFSKIVHLGVDSDEKLFTGVAGKHRAAKARAAPKRKSTKPRKGLEDYRLKAMKPKQHEGVFAFASRIAQRHGLWLWASPDGEALMVGEPNYQQAPLWYFYRNERGSNMLDGSTVKFDIKDQPGIIFADGASGGGEYGRSKMARYMANPFTGVQPDGTLRNEFKITAKTWPDAKQVFFGADTQTEGFSLPEGFRLPLFYTPQIARPLYLHDEESTTPEQLEAFLQREMSLRVAKALSVRVKVAGHGQVVDGDFVPFSVNTVAVLDDQVTGLEKVDFYVKGRTFEKSRGGGTTTTLDLVVPGSLTFESGGKE